MHMMPCIQVSYIVIYNSTHTLYIQHVLFGSVKIFHDPLNRINVWGCITVLLGVVMYKVHFHMSKRKKLSQQQSNEEPPSAPKKQQYRKIKSHFSDDGGDNETANLNDLEEFLDEDEDDNLLVPGELEMPTAHRRSSNSGNSIGNGHMSDDSEMSTSSSARQQLV